MSRHLMLVPSLACPASCSYCFGPHEGGPPMRRETVEAVVRWQQVLGDVDPLEITFHGGEPLVPGAAFYREALPLLREGLAPRRVRFAIQSNLWLLTDELCDLFRTYKVSIGTSLDGPEHINDAQRGKGYFQRTMAGIKRARSHGFSVGCICTFTSQSVAHAQDIFDFFVHEGLNFSIHAALPSLRHPQADDWSLSPEAHSQLLEGMLDRYLDNQNRVRIGTLDSMARSITVRCGGICTFGDCLGNFLAVGPNGDITPCQRLIGMVEYRMGNVHDVPSWEMIAKSQVWRSFREREEHIKIECGGCVHLSYCQGGCPYNGLVSRGGSIDAVVYDPHCLAYRRVFSYMIDRALSEVFSEENMTVVLSDPDCRAGLLRKGALLAIMSPHAVPASVRTLGPTAGGSGRGNEG